MNLAKKYKGLIIKIKYFSIVLWLLCIGVFMAGQNMAPPNYHLLPNNPWGNLFGISFMTGVVAFATAIAIHLWIPNKVHKKPQNKSGILRLKVNTTSAVTYIFFGILLMFSILAYKSSILGDKLFKTSSVTPTKEKSPTPTTKPEITAKLIFKFINDFRNSVNLPSVIWDSESCKISDDILLNKFWSTNFKMNDYSSECPTCFNLSVAQARDYYSVDSLLGSWKSNTQTLNTLKDTGKNGCVSYSGGNTVFVVVKKNATSTTNNTDPTIDCKSTAQNCYGSTIKVQKSQCSNITCCQIGDTWSLYPSSSECTKAQNSTNQAKGNLPNTTKSVTNSVYCWNNAYGYAYYTTSGDQCNIDNAKSTSYKICMDTQKLKSDTCSTTCKNELNDGNALCAWAYTGSNAAIANDPDLYGECLNGTEGTGELYGICLGKCTDQYSQDIQQCSF